MGGDDNAVVVFEDYGRVFPVSEECRKILDAYMDDRRANLEMIQVPQFKAVQAEEK